MHNKNNFISEEKALRYILGFLFCVIFAIALFSESSFDAGDGLQHYIMARYSWLHPYLLLDSWGKPFYTLISSPFAQFGLSGSIFFNIMCGIGSAYFVYKLSKKIQLENAWMVIPFVLFSPGYFPTLNSGLTEPFFSFILVASAYGFVCKKYGISCILISFLPFVRTEGFFILPLFLIVLLYRRRFFEILLLGFGTLVYSLIGKFFLNDFFWIVNQNPYNGSNKEIYGHGEITHFIANHNYLLGTILLIFFLAGIVGFFTKILSIKRNNIQIKDTFLAEEFILIMGSFIFYLAAHSIMWWKGWANSLGMLRVMAGVLPCASILCLRGFNMLLFDKFKKVPVLKNSIIAIVLALVVITPFKKEYFPF
jgi:Gpi18-like mannosyltransferase